MKKIFMAHYISTAILLILAILLRRWFDYQIFLPLLAGGLIGAILPDLDHLIYIYLLKPTDPASISTTELIKNKRYKQALEFLTLTRSARKDLIFHNALFQLLFFVFAYLIVTSSINFFGKGLVLAFLVHLVVDQYIDLKANGNLNSWFTKFNFTMDKKQQTFYWVLSVIVIFIFAVLF